MNEKGFSLIELIITISILTIFGGIVAFNFSTFRDKAKMDELVHEIALEIRSVQQKAMSGGIESLSTNTSNLEKELTFGIYFPGNLDGNKIVKFEDLDGDFKYDGALDDCENECLDILGLPTKFEVENQELNITFTRPYSEATIYIDGNKANIPASIIFISEKFSREIVVEQIGRIYTRRIDESD